MTRYAALIFSLALLMGCQGAGVKSFWKTHRINLEDIQQEEDQFASFAQLAVRSQEKDALEALDGLFDILREDEVMYYVYTDWMDAAFYSLLSPCRSAVLYSKAVERMVEDGILNGSDIDSRLQRKDWINYNTKGVKATVPGAVIREHTLVLVLDQGCPSCKDALAKLSADWKGVRLLAICCGNGPLPVHPGWEYLTDNQSRVVFDPQMTPIYFVVDADGTVEIPYTLVF